MFAGIDSKKAQEAPIHAVFRYLKSDSQRIRIYLNHNNKMVIEGTIKGFDEFMNLVLFDAVEIYSDDTRINLGTTLLRGESIGIIHQITSSNFE